MGKQKKNHDLCHASLIQPLRDENIICKTNANFSPWSRKLHNMQQNAKCILLLSEQYFAHKRKHVANIR